MTKYAYERVGRGEPMPGVIIVDPDAVIGRVVEDLLIIAEATNRVNSKIVSSPTCRLDKWIDYKRGGKSGQL